MTYVVLSLSLSNIIILLQASQLFKPREAEQDFFKNIIESGPQDPTFLQDDDEAQVIRSSMRTLAWISYRFGNVTKDMKEAKFRQPFHDLLELAFDYPAENEELPGKLLYVVDRLSDTHLISSNLNFLN